MSSFIRDWKIYRTRFLIKAIRLDGPLTFTDPLGREHSGQKGDYLVESADGFQRIAPRAIFEDIYVPMESSRKLIPQNSCERYPKARPKRSDPHSSAPTDPARNPTSARRWSEKTA